LLGISVVAGSAWCSLGPAGDRSRGAMPIGGSGSGSRRPGLRRRRRMPCGIRSRPHSTNGRGTSSWSRGRWDIAVWLALSSMRTQAETNSEGLSSEHARPAGRRAGLVLGQDQRRATKERSKVRVATARSAWVGVRKNEISPRGGQARPFLVLSFLRTAFGPGITRPPRTGLSFFRSFVGPHGLLVVGAARSNPTKRGPPCRQPCPLNYQRPSRRRSSSMSSGRRLGLGSGAQVSIDTLGAACGGASLESGKSPFRPRST
jgi:hypothetical protein